MANRILRRRRAMRRGAPALVGRCQAAGALAGWAASGSDPRSRWAAHREAV